MKKFEKFKLKVLDPADLSKIKGGQDICPGIFASCSPNCGHFSDYIPGGTFTTYYQLFISCVTSHTMACSPLYGWGLICGNYN